MDDKRSGSNPQDWEAAVSQAADHVAGAPGAFGAGGPARGPADWIHSPTAVRLLVALPVLAAILAWNVWSAGRPPELPPDEEIAHALRQTAGALAEEALALQAELGRLPTPADLAGEVDEELTYVLSGDGFLITNTDGVLRVRYDGTIPVAAWVANGGYTLVRGGR